MMKWKRALLTWYQQYRYQKTMRQIRNLWSSFDCDLSHLTNFEIELGIFTAAGIIVINNSITADEFATAFQEFKEHP